MGLGTRTGTAPGGDERDEADFARLRHARERQLGFPVGQYLQPAPLLFTRDGHNVFLGDMYRGRPAFLICSGPSLKSQDLTPLQQRGFLTMAVNNAATIVRPNLWCSVDDPKNFCDVIWRDPGILKFVPLCHMEKKFSVRDERGNLTDSDECVGDMPAVFGFRRNESFVAEQFLTEDTVNWGNHGNRVDTYGHKGSRSVMLAALRILYFLGVRQIYLLGCDFQMAEGTQNYAFEQDRSRGSVRGNNQAYRALNDRFRHLIPHFNAAGLHVYNCTPNSNLSAFPMIPYEDAVDVVRGTVPQEILTANMYDRGQRSSEIKDQIPADTARASSVSLPGPNDTAKLTVVVPLQPGDDRRLSYTWPTWMKFKPWMREAQVMLIRHSNMDGDVGLRTVLDSHQRVRVEDARQVAGRTSRDAWEWYKVREVPQLLETEWYLMLDPNAVAIAESDWLGPTLFDDAGMNERFAFAACQWSYTKPADVYQRLDDWADTVTDLRGCPRLDWPFSPQRDRVQHKAISSWSFFVRTEWAKRVAGYVSSSLPFGDHASFSLFCAARARLQWLRIPMKQSGWDHSFSWNESSLSNRCVQALRSGEYINTNERQ